MNVSAAGSFYVEFLNVPSMGALSVGYVSPYYPGATLNASNVNSTNFYVNYAGSAYSISDVSYVPGYYQSNTDTVKYAAYSLNSQLLYIGEIGFYGTGSGSDCYPMATPFPRPISTVPRTRTPCIPSPFPADYGHPVL